MPETNLHPQVHTLAQGIRFVSYPMPEAASVAVLVLVGVGSRYEQSSQSGIAHFLEHLFFKGTAKRPTGMDIAASVDVIGGEFNAFTGKEYTGFYIKAAAKDIHVCLDVLSDILFHSTFPDQEIERERGVILEEMNMYLDSPRDRVGEIYEQLLYPNQPLGREVIGTRETVGRLTRPEFIDFSSTWYTANNLVIGVAGQFDQSSIKPLIESQFNHPSTKPLPSFPPAAIHQTKPALSVQTKQTDQTHMVVGLRSFPSTDARRYPLAILNTVLGGNMSSRLFTEVREKRGLAYAVSTHVEDYLDAGSLQCQVGLDVKQLPAALPVILAEFAKTKTAPIPEEELNRTKSYMRGRLALSLEDPLSMIFFQTKQLLLEQHIQTADELLNQIDQVTSPQIQAVAQEIFQPANLNLAIIGPTNDTAMLENLLVL